MDTKIIVLESDGGLYSLQIDTNRVVTDFGQSVGVHFLYIVLGILFNGGLSVVSFYQIAEERKNDAILKAYKDKAEADADGKAKE